MTLQEIIEKVEAFCKQRDAYVPGQPAKSGPRRAHTYLLIREFTHFPNNQGNALCTPRKYKGIQTTKTIGAINCPDCRSILAAWKVEGV